MEKKFIKKLRNISSAFWIEHSVKNKNTKSTKICKITICIIINIVVITAIWLVLLQLIVSTLYFPPIEHEGLTIYTSGDYIKYDNSTVFSSFISSLSFIDDTQITNFYYYDNKKSDNLIYGKQGDFFILELQFSEDFNCVKTDIECNYSYVFTYGDYCAYEIKLQDQQLNINNRFLVMLCDKTKTVRCVYHTDDRTSNITSVVSALGNDCLLEWKTD